MKFEWFTIKKMKGSKKKGACYRIKCNDCKNKIYIYPIDQHDKFGFSEIGGVIGTKQDWNKLFTYLKII